MTADESKPALDKETTGGQTDFTTPDDDLRTPGENRERGTRSLGSRKRPRRHIQTNSKRTNLKPESRTNPPRRNCRRAKAQTAQPNAAETEEPDEPPRRSCRRAKAQTAKPTQPKPKRT